MSNKFLLNPVTGKLDLTEDISSQFADAEISAEKVILTSEGENLADVKNAKEAFEKIAAKVWYSKIKINSFKVTSGTPQGDSFEVGYTATAPVLTWTTSKTPVSVVCDGKTLSATDTTYTLENITKDKTVTLTVTEKEGGTASASLKWAFGYALYTGMTTIPSSFTQDWVKTILGGKTVKKSAGGDYTLKGSSTDYWWIVCPTAWSLKFTTKIGDGGAEKVGTVDDFINDYGVTVPMTVYRANQIQSEDTTITIK